MFPIKTRHHSHVKSRHLPDVCFAVPARNVNQFNIEQEGSL